MILESPDQMKMRKMLGERREMRRQSQGWAETAFPRFNMR